MHDLLRLGIEPVFPAMVAGFFFTGPPGNPVCIFFITSADITVRVCMRAKSL